MLVSIIIPSFNKGRFLNETVSSVLAQSYPRKEIIIINDGSTDNTKEIATSLIRDNPATSICYLEKENSGISDTRNFAINTARGDLITTLDGDDLMADGYLNEVVETFQKNPELDLVSCTVELFGKEQGSWNPESYETYSERYNNNIPTLVTYKKDLWKRAGGYNVAFPFNEDWDFFLAGQETGLQVAKLDKPFLKYRVDESGLAHQFIKDTWEYSVSLMMTSHPELYPISQVFQAHETLYKMPERWSERFKTQQSLHPHSWLLSFWIGLSLMGKDNLADAIGAFQKAAVLSENKKWQPLFLLGKCAEKTGDKNAAITCFHLVRTLRPDTMAALGAYFQ